MFVAKTKFVQAKRMYLWKVSNCSTLKIIDTERFENHVDLFRIIYERYKAKNMLQ